MYITMSLCFQKYTNCYFLLIFCNTIWWYKNSGKKTLRDLNADSEKRISFLYFFVIHFMRNTLNWKRKKVWKVIKILVHLVFEKSLLVFFVTTFMWSIPSWKRTNWTKNAFANTKWIQMLMFFCFFLSFSIKNTTDEMENKNIRKNLPFFDNLSK